jgi:HSP20 family protein
MMSRIRMHRGEAARVPEPIPRAPSVRAEDATDRGRDAASARAVGRSGSASWRVDCWSRRQNLHRRNVMADIVKKNGGQAIEWDPMRAMRAMLRWDPFREMAPLASLEPGLFSPSFDVTENKDTYMFRADIPGVKKEDIEVTTIGNRLQISGKRESEHETKTDTVYTFERQHGSFSRSFTLPDDADLDATKSDLKDGVLSLFVPKKAGAQAKKIAISSGAKS